MTSRRNAPSVVTRAAAISMAAAHGPVVLAIYWAGIDEGGTTSETSASDWDAFTADGSPATAASPPTEPTCSADGASSVSACPVYAAVVKHSVYFHPAARGQSIGRSLDTLIAST